MNASTLTEPEFAHHLAIAEDAARTAYPADKLRYRDRGALECIRGFAEMDAANEGTIYDRFDRAQTRHHAVIVRGLVTTELDRRHW